MMCDFSDDQLLELFEIGDAIAFEEIYNRYWLKLYSSAYKRLNKREQAQEIVQDLFTSFWLNRTHLKIHTSLQGYLFSSIKYSVLNYKRAESVRTTYSEAYILADDFYDNSTEEYISYRDLKETVDNGINKLPPKCRNVFELSRNQYKTNREIAQLMGISEKTVENHLTKALRVLRLSMNILMLLLFIFSK